ncbi:MAG TPA: cytochrome c [Gammaproteobacteria bacterium]|nr:cytochrome c [Gammaproteobacteria bacterium]
MRVKRLIAIGCMALLGSTAYAAGDATEGRKLAGNCIGCHGIPSYTNVYPTFRVPRLGGQHADYLVSALQGYKKGDRKHATMQAQAATLSDQDMQNLAAYFSTFGQ